MACLFLRISDHSDAVWRIPDIGLDHKVHHVTDQILHRQITDHPQHHRITDRQLLRIIDREVQAVAAVREVREMVVSLQMNVAKIAHLIQENTKPTALIILMQIV